MYLFNYIKNQQFYFCIERIFARKYPRPATHPAWVRRLEWVGGGVEWGGGGEPTALALMGSGRGLPSLNKNQH